MAEPKEPAVRAAAVAQISKSAVSRISKSADATPGAPAAGLETGDTADVEVCATGPTNRGFIPHQRSRQRFGFLGMTSVG